MITIKETTQRELTNVKQLWVDGDVMKFVGFPDGLHETDEGMSDWFDWILSARPKTNHFSIFDNNIYCGETFYNIDIEHNNSASLDIKLFRFARGKGIGLYERLEFVSKPMPDYLVEEDGVTSIYMDLLMMNPQLLQLWIDFLKIMDIAMTLEIADLTMQH